MSEFLQPGMLLEYRGMDTVFTVIRILTMLTYIVWPLVAFVTIMALGGKAGPNIGPVKLYALKTLYLLAFVYPFVFMLLVNFSEKILTTYSYALGVIVALLPMVLCTLVFWWLKAKPSYSPEDSSN